MDNPNHHIWNNNGTYFIHLTVRRDDAHKVRVRKSLGTKDVELARLRRDRVIENLRSATDLALVIR